jgi:hypothetical protein
MMDNMSRRPKKSGPTEPPGPDAPENLRAHWWRESVMELSRPALAEKIGRSVAYIEDMERGAQRITGAPITDYTAYRMACAAVAAGLEFDWQTCRVRVGGAVIEIGRSAV